MAYMRTTNSEFYVYWDADKNEVKEEHLAVFYKDDDKQVYTLSQCLQAMETQDYTTFPHWNEAKPNERESIEMIVDEFLFDLDEHDLRFDGSHSYDEATRKKVISNWYTKHTAMEGDELIQHVKMWKGIDLGA